MCEGFKQIITLKVVLGFSKMIMNEKSRKIAEDVHDIKFLQNCRMEISYVSEEVA